MPHDDRIFRSRPLVDQPTAAPTRKVAAGGISGAIALTAVWVLSLGGVDVPAEVAATWPLIVAAVVAYFTRERADDRGSE